MTRGQAGPTAHALMVFGGAVGMVMAAAGLFVLSAQLGPAMHGCAHCRILAAGAVVALIVGALLVRAAWRTMRVPGAR